MTRSRETAQTGPQKSQGMTAISFHTYPALAFIGGTITLFVEKVVEEISSFK